MLTVQGPDELRAHTGHDLGVSEWFDVTQDAIDAFARATGDFQWIHVDPERAKESRFGRTIAHGLFTLSLGPQLSEQVFAIEGFEFAVNYGYARVRFPSPLPSGLRVRLRSTLVSTDDVEGGIQACIRQTFEIEGAEKPACVADALARYYM